MDTTPIDSRSEDEILPPATLKLQGKLGSETSTNGLGVQPSPDGGLVDKEKNNEVQQHVTTSVLEGDVELNKKDEENQTVNITSMNCGKESDPQTDLAPSTLTIEELSIEEKEVQTNGTEKDLTSESPETPEGTSVPVTNGPEAVETANNILPLGGLEPATEGERLKLDEFRAIIDRNPKDFSCDEINIKDDRVTFHLGTSTLIRFLRARQGDVDAAVEMLSKHIQWRNRVHPSLINTSDVAMGLKEECVAPAGISRNGFPVLLIKAANFVPSKYPSEPGVPDGEFPPPEFENFIAFALEETLRKGARYDAQEHTKYSRYEENQYQPDLRHLEGAREKIVLMIDLKGFSLTAHFSRLGVRRLKQLVVMLQLNYPEILHTLVFFNSPMLFNTAWKVISRWLDASTLAKVFIASKKTKEALHALIDPLSLEEKFMGKKKEPYEDFQ